MRNYIKYVVQDLANKTNTHVVKEGEKRMRGKRRKGRFRKQHVQFTIFQEKTTACEAT